MAKKTVDQTWMPEEYQAAFECNVAAFLVMHSQLLKRYKGQWVAIYDRKLVEHDADGSTLHCRMMKKFGNNTPWYMQRVVEEIIPIEVIPGIDIE